MSARKPKPMWQMLADSLNEYAGYIERREPVPMHAPSSACFWFDGLARELHALAGTSFMDLLTPAACVRFWKVVTK